MNARLLLWQRRRFHDRLVYSSPGMQFSESFTGPPLLVWTYQPRYAVRIEPSSMMIPPLISQIQLSFSPRHTRLPPPNGIFKLFILMQLATWAGGIFCIFIRYCFLILFASIDFVILIGFFKKHFRRVILELFLGGVTTLSILMWNIFAFLFAVCIKYFGGILFFVVFGELLFICSWIYI